MKSLAIYIILSILISFSLQNSSTANIENFFESEVPCESKCLACQKTAYNLKFYQAPNCKKNNCKSTCYKVHSQWNAPGSVFSNFQNDSLGKCEVCFRAGYCTMSECEVQRKFEVSVINSVVDKASFNGIVDNKPLKEMMKKVMNNNKIDFKKMVKKVKSNISKATKFVNKKAEKKLAKAINLLNSGKKSRKASVNKNKSLSSSKLIKIVRESLRSFRTNVSLALSVKKNKKLYSQKKNDLKKQYMKIKSSIQSFIGSFAKNLKVLENTHTNFTQKVKSLSLNIQNNEALDNLLKTIGESIKKIKNESKEAKDALESLKKLFNSL